MRGWLDIEYHKSYFLALDVLLDNLLEQFLHSLAGEGGSFVVKAIPALGSLEFALLLGDASVLDQVLLVADEA
jgi:hypothetical protein